MASVTDVCPVAPTASAAKDWAPSERAEVRFVWLRDRRYSFLKGPEGPVPAFRMNGVTTIRLPMKPVGGRKRAVGTRSGTTGRANETGADGASELFVFVDSVTTLV